MEEIPQSDIDLINQIKALLPQHPDLSGPGCIVNFAPDGSSEVIPFGDARCSK